MGERYSFRSVRKRRSAGGVCLTVSGNTSHRNDAGSSKLPTLSAFLLGESSASGRALQSRAAPSLCWCPVVAEFVHCGRFLWPWQFGFDRSVDRSSYLGTTQLLHRPACLQRRTG